MEKENWEKLRNSVNVRFSDSVYKILKTKSEESDGQESMSDIVRDAMSYYLAADISNPKLMYEAQNTLKQTVENLETKLDLLSIIFLEFCKRMISYLPARPSMEGSVADYEYRKFMEKVSDVLQKEHGGIIEGMVLDIYSKGVKKNGND